MKDFLGFSLITAGCGAMLYALVVGISTNTDLASVGGLGLVAAVIGAAIIEKK